MTIFDCKDSIIFDFRREKQNDDDYELKFIESIIEREILDRFIVILNNYFHGFYEGYSDNLYTEYEKMNPYLGIKYGYQNGSFYCVKHVSE